MIIRACRWQDEAWYDTCCKERVSEKFVDASADLILVSNHGGHSLGYLPHPLQVIDEFVAVVDDSFRLGSNVLKGLAFGAKLVGLGRPILYGLAADGESTVDELISGIGCERDRVMTLAGASLPEHIEKSMLIET